MVGAKHCYTCLRQMRPNDASNWFVVAIMMCRIFLVTWSTHRILIFVPKYAIVIRDDLWVIKYVTCYVPQKI